jgi:hypothetical protein
MLRKTRPYLFSESGDLKRGLKCPTEWTPAGTGGGASYAASGRGLSTRIDTVSNGVNTFRGCRMQDAGYRMQAPCVRFPLAGLGLWCSVFGPRRRTGSGAGYPVSGTRHLEPGTWYVGHGMARSLLEVVGRSAGRGGGCAHRDC